MLGKLGCLGAVEISGVEKCGFGWCGDLVRGWLTDQQTRNSDFARGAQCMVGTDFTTPF